MPFGWVRSSPPSAPCNPGSSWWPVSNAFRLGPFFTPKLTRGTPPRTRRLQCLSAGSVLHHRWRCELFAQRIEVSNAFRLGPFFTARQSRRWRARTVGLQCLSAGSVLHRRQARGERRVWRRSPMPFGWVRSSPKREQRDPKLMLFVSNAFRLGPFFTLLAPADFLTFSNVSNAFRLGPFFTVARIR